MHGYLCLQDGSLRTFYLLQCLELLWHEQAVISSLAFFPEDLQHPQDQAEESDASILMKDLCTIRLASFRPGRNPPSASAARTPCRACTG